MKRKKHTMQSGLTANVAASMLEVKRDSGNVVTISTFGRKEFGDGSGGIAGRHRNFKWEQF